MRTDDDVRDMLRSKAAEVRVSDDGWQKIAARIEGKPARPVGRRLALAGAAAAAVAGTVFVANLPGPTSQVATPDTTTTNALAPAAGDPVITAHRWVQERFPDVEVPSGQLQGSEDENASVVFRGAVDTEVFVRQLSGRAGWAVVAAASDMIPVFDVTYDGRDLQGRATPEATGEVTINYLVDGAAAGEHEIRQVRAGEDIALGYGSDVAGGTAGVRVTLTVGGTRYLSEVTAERVVDPAVATGSYVAVWPATDSAGLAALQRQADDGFRPDLLDPQAVAGAFLAELLPRGESPTSYSVDEFQQGDNTSGEVPYTLSGGASGTVLVRTTGGEGAIWFVAGATSDDLRIETTRREETHLVADVWSDTDGTLTWTGATPVEVRSGQTVSIGRPDTPVGTYPVVVRLMDGDRTLALAAQLG